MNLPRLIISLKGYASIRVDYEEDQLAQGKFIKAIKAVLEVGPIADPPEGENQKRKPKIAFYKCKECNKEQYKFVFTEEPTVAQCRCGHENFLGDFKLVTYRCECSYVCEIYAVNGLKEIRCRNCKNPVSLL
jgi:hypothetical protein